MRHGPIKLLAGLGRAATEGVEAVGAELVVDREEQERQRHRRPKERPHDLAVGKSARAQGHRLAGVGELAERDHRRDEEGHRQGQARERRQETREAGQYPPERQSLDHREREQAQELVHEQDAQKQGDARPERREELPKKIARHDRHRRILPIRPLATGAAKR
jgi:hypothetical protein